MASLKNFLIKQRVNDETVARFYPKISLDLTVFSEIVEEVNIPLRGVTYVGTFTNTSPRCPSGSEVWVKIK